jgi:DNA-nicking Smr family endonuclease
VPKKPLTPEDQKIWNQVAQTMDIFWNSERIQDIGIEGSEKPPSTLPPISAPISHKPKFSSPQPQIIHRKELRKIAIQRRLDLHGMTQREAHDELLRFIPQAYFDGLKSVLIITGKGSRGDGILKNRVPVWLGCHPLHGFIRGVSTASPKDGGAGALYVLLKSSKKEVNP